MPEFTYQALDSSGRVATGNIIARDTSEAAVKVRALGVYPTQIADSTGHAVKGKETKAAAVPPGSNVKVKRIQILLFTREMADMLDAGMPIDRAFSVLVDQMADEVMVGMLSEMQSGIRAGQPLSEVLKKYPKQFNNLYANMIHAGEVSGQLPGVMERLADFMEREQMRRSQIAAALTYPAVLMVVAVLAITFLLTFVVPKLSGIFKDMGSALPLPTKILLLVSGLIGQYWLEILPVIIVAVVAFRFWAKSANGQIAIDRYRMRAPVVGTLVQKIVAARLVRTLGTLLAGGVPILESLEISASALGSVVSEEALNQVRDGVRQGETLHDSMQKSDIFLPVVLHMTAVGEETGRLPSMLLRTANTLDFEVDNTMRRFTSLVEPLVVLFMGGFIGFVVLSILLPIFESTNLVK